MLNWSNWKFSTKITLSAVGSVLLTVFILMTLATWQTRQSTALATDQINRAIDIDLSHLVQSTYNMIKAQAESAQQQVTENLNTARYVLNTTGPVSQAADTVEWTAVNQFTQQSVKVQLAKVLIGAQWLGQNSDPKTATPVVDDIERLTGATATIFQRMNDRGDMLRVATTVKATDGKRAISTYIPTVNPDGTPNPVVSTVLQGKPYYGDAYVVNAMYLTAYEPIVDKAGKIIGMLYVGLKRDDVMAPAREAILKMQVGETGYVYVVGGAGEELGRYIISQRGERDGENIWDSQDVQGRYVVRDIITHAIQLKPEQAVERYLWQNPGDPAPRWKVARTIYYEPWHWVIGAGTYEDELQEYQETLQQAQARTLSILGMAGLGLAILLGILGFVIARSLVGPLNHLTTVATQIAGGNLSLTARVTQRDEIGTLAQSFNSMTAQLRDLIGSLEQRVAERTADLERRSRYLTAQAQIARDTTSILDADRLIQQIVELIRAQFDLYYVGLFLVDETGEWVVLRAGTGEAGQQLLARGYRRHVGEGMTGWVIANRQARFAQDVEQDTVRIPMAELPATRAEGALPLQVGNRVLGALTLQSRYLNRFDADMIAVLQTMADQVATALENARLFAASQAALAAERRAYGEITRGAWTQMAQTLAIGGYRSTDEGLYVSDGEWTPEMRQAAKSKQAIAAHSAAVPIVVRDHVLGTLNFRKPDGHDTWTDQELGLLTTLAEQLGVALESARLYQDTQRRAAQERLVGEVTARIRETLDLDTVLKTAAQEIGQSLGLGTLDIQLSVDDRSTGAREARH